MEDVITQEFACESCGNTTPIPNETCTVCGGKMFDVNAPTKPSKAIATGDETDDEIDDSAEAPSEEDEGTFESLEDLQAKEAAEDDESDYNQDS